MLILVGLILAEDRLQSGLNKGPGTSVKWLFLCPDDLFKVRISLKLIANLCPREGMKLLNASNSNIVDPVCRAMLYKGSIHLA
jgi:hypothetical protein